LVAIKISFLPEKLGYRSSAQFLCYFMQCTFIVKKNMGNPAAENAAARKPRTRAPHTQRSAPR
jgi:hypothetical protein